MGEFIRVVNPAMAKELVEAGFSYIKESDNGTETLVFLTTPELLAYMGSRFEKSEYVFDSKLRF